MSAYPIPGAGQNDGVLRLLCVSHPSAKKSDAFLFTMNGRVLLLDGGFDGCTDALERMLALREELMPGGGRLPFVWVISHFHIDHVAAAIRSILEDERFLLTDVYYPPLTSLGKEFIANGDRKYRVPMREVILRRHPDAVLHELQWQDRGGAPVEFSLGGAAVTLLPPDTDWANPKEQDIIVNGYYDGDPGPGKVATCVINSSSVWMKVAYAGRRLIFTGDTMKRTAEIGDESWDRMFRLWRDEIGEEPDLMKWIHHGMVRDNAAPKMMELHPKNILVTTPVETASAVCAEQYPERSRDIRFWNCSFSDVSVTVAPDGGFEILQLREE